MTDHPVPLDCGRAATTPGARISCEAQSCTIYDPEEPGYWDPALLKAEQDRAFEICNGCRMCFKYCDAFPGLFALLDQVHQGDVRALTQAERHRVLDACFQCKLCEVQCPYTPREDHGFALDFPALVHRSQALRRRQGGPRSLARRLRDRLLRDPDLAGRLARSSFGLANRLRRAAAHRWLMDKVLGVHRSADLPGFEDRTFEDWAGRSGRILDHPGAEAVLFQTCFVQHNDHQLGRDTLDVLAANGVRAGCVRGLQCCGMPAWEQGDLEAVRRQARANLDALMPHVDAGSKVLVVNPTCALMLRREYPNLLAGEDRLRAQRLAQAVRDPGEFLWSIRLEPRANRDFKSSPGPVAYHAPCHLRAQAVGFRGRDLLRRIPGVTIVPVLECCGHDGTYGLKSESFEAARRVGAKAFQGMAGAQAQVWASECPLAAFQFQQHAGRRSLHPMTILARAYRPDGFPDPIQPDPIKED